MGTQMEMLNIIIKHAIQLMSKLFYPLHYWYILTYGLRNEKEDVKSETVGKKREHIRYEIYIFRVNSLNCHS